MTFSEIQTGRFATGGRKYLWLLAGTVLGLFALHHEWSIPLTGWLFCVCLMRYTRSSGALAGFGVAWSASALATVVFLVASQRFEFGLILFGCLGMSTVLVLPLLVDRLVSARIGAVSALLATLVFPATRVAAEFLISEVSPFGSIFGPLATTQTANLPLLQVVSVTGIYGISFLMAWLAPVANHVLERRFDWLRSRAVVLAFAGVLVAVLLGGGTRLAFAATPGDVVRVAGISPSVTAEQQFAELDNFGVGDVTADQLPQLRQAFTIITDDLFARSWTEARAGADIVVWPEAGAVTLRSDLPDLVERAAALARQEQIYLELGVVVVSDTRAPERNITILVGPDGRTLWTYDKAHPVPGLEDFTPGDGVVPTTDTPFGTVANVICYDADFPSLMRQAGPGEIDIMFVPSNDWKGFEKTHSEAAVFRAVENGYSVVRQTSNGISTTVDDHGRQLAGSNYFSSPQQTMIAFVPTQGSWTVYGAVGDLFAWLSVAGSIMLILVACRRRGAPVNDDSGALSGNSKLD